VAQPVRSLPSAIQSATTPTLFTTAFTATLASDLPNAEGICLVQRLRASLLAPNLTGTQVRITLRGSTAGSLTLDRITISTVGNTGDPYDSGPDLTDLAPGAVTIAAGGTATLGPVSYNFNSSQDLLVAFDINPTQGQGNLRRVRPLPGADQFGQTATAEAGVQDRATGYLIDTNVLYLIEKIEVL
jgi:hypothetical protein